LVNTNRSGRELPSGLPSGIALQPIGPLDSMAAYITTAADVADRTRRHTRAD
jgi:hypothetical protein